MDSSNSNSITEGESIQEQFAEASLFSLPTTMHAPVEWSRYFDKEEDISIPGSNDVFHVYMAGTDGPVVFCLHGGGYAALSFALAANKIKEDARVVAMDLRGHGKSVTEKELDLSIQTMCDDVLAVVKQMYGDSPPAIVLVGHSMGGSVAVHVAAKQKILSLAGLVVVDVVEGSAIHMQQTLANRMHQFPSVEHAINYSVNEGTLGNLISACVSVPPTLKYDDSQQCYVYRTRLEETARYWRGWYEGLSEKFLSSHVPKLLILAGVHTLDRALTIGQMQGKLQIVVVKHTGHAVQEDAPGEFASLILKFISRHRIRPRAPDAEMPGIAQPFQRRP